MMRSSESGRKDWPRRTVMTLAMLLAVGTAMAATDDPRRDATVESVAKVMPAVVNIGTETIVQVRDPVAELFQRFYGPSYRRRPPSSQYSLGSGVIIDETGYVLTNDHVTRRANRIWVKLSEEAGGKTYEAERVAGSEESDVALLRLQAEPDERFTAVKFAADDDISLGETVIALGNPFGLGGSVSRGILSSKSRRPPQENSPLSLEDWLQTDAAINPGNSGGPLINLRGELIGLNVAVFSEGQGIGFAIPVKRVAEALADIFSPAIGRMWFGALVRPATSGVTVTRVEPDSPAARAGLREGDLITEVKGQPITGFIEFTKDLLASGNDQEIKLAYERNGVRRETTTRLLAETEVFNAQLINRKTGLSLQELSPKLAERLGLWTTEGLLVAGVDQDSPAEELGIKAGSLIIGLDGTPVNDVVSAARLLYRKKAGEEVRVVLLIHMPRGEMIFHQRLAGDLKVR
ncbi:MAG: trypsin-like peptidase domain-containing protein [Verrucomicrobiales bacterium]|nr:trypsin-like peptidase domain-containing protein [Verrucomicrobiales bacterium]